MNEDRLLRPREAAARLGVSPGTLYYLVRRGRIPRVKLLGSRCNRFRLSDIERAIRGEPLIEPPTEAREG